MTAWRRALLALALAGCAHSPSPRVVETTSQVTYHQVVRGETLTSIARRYRTTVEALARLNELADPDRILVGMVLAIPPPSTTGGPARERVPGTLLLPVAASARADHVAVPPLAWPAEGPLASRFGRRDGRPHEGLDIAVPDDTQVHAAAAGRVLYVGDALHGYGLLVLLRHDEHLVTVYAHLARALVEEGAAVVAGQVIALSGHSGRATAPHLHFEVRIDGVPRNPERYLGRTSVAARRP